MKTREMICGCSCCTLRISMEYTLRNFIASYKSDTIIIEPTGIAFPGQIKSNIENMGLPGITFVPRVNLEMPDAWALPPESYRNSWKTGRRC
ncbi:GTP-binding protein [Methanosarcina sp. Z-7115]|uniref:GTP-binding protein n=1 Tax=Methanosarcina baikalica TaxID=3073890 RepID=A0ABU2CWX9_9EURY|nr:GTP-binding protein [Methanosarcina sp. Z-7115]MDR7664236.1 GTP-binding protein [Methanosarcina sp. Z-7115]